ncbi:MAG: nucleotidyltransferase family protein, partial [Vicinamibacterales bacterium]
HLDADTGFWARSVTASIGGVPVRLPCPGDLLLHVCVHGLRWNPVHSCHWVADAASIIGKAAGRLDWEALVDESRRRDVTLQVHDALDLVRHVAAVDIPAAVFGNLMHPRPSWRARIERRVKTRPLYGPGGLLLMWFDWRRLRASHPQENTIGFPDYLAASMRLASSRAIVPAMTRHLMRRFSA